MSDDKLFKVYVKRVEDAAKAKIFEDLLNAPRFREALLREFEKTANEMARSVMNEAWGLVKEDEK